VSRVRFTIGRRRRVYLIRTAWLLTLVALLAPVAAARTPAEITIEPVMVKGAERARVTIVEFSDYQ
jgi:hypothetical protein